MKEVDLRDCIYCKNQDAARSHKDCKTVFSSMLCFSCLEELGEDGIDEFKKEFIKTEAQHLKNMPIEAIEIIVKQWYT